MRRRSKEAGTDPFPIRGAIGVILLVGLVIMAPGAFTGFFHFIVNKAFSGIAQDPNACLYSCAADSPQNKNEPPSVTQARSLPAKADCQGAATGTKPTLKAQCAVAPRVCATKYRLSPEGKHCTAKGWPIKAQAKLPTEPVTKK